MTEKSTSFILYPKDSYKITLFARTLIISAAGFFVAIKMAEPGAWYVGIIAGLISLIFLIGLLSRSETLKLTKKGFEIVTLFGKSHFYSWNEIESFQVKKMRWIQMVVFNYNANHKKSRPAQLIKKVLGGTDGALPNSYNKNPEELAKLMNEWRTKFI